MNLIEPGFPPSASLVGQYFLQMFHFLCHSEVKVFFTERTDRNQAMLQNVAALEFASRRLRAMKSLALEAVALNTAALQHLTPELRRLEQGGSPRRLRCERNIEKYLQHCSPSTFVGF